MNKIGKGILKRDLLVFKTKEELVEMDMNMLDEIENLQSKIDKAIELNGNIRKKLLTCSSYEKDKVEDLLFEQLDILKEV